jgi:hypothetical protein
LVKLNEKVAAFGAATREGSLFFLAALAIVSIVQLYRSPVDSSALPQAELEFLKSKPQFMPLLHDSFLGGYVLNRFSDAEGNPVLRAAYDERTLQADPQIAYAARQLEDLGPLWKEVFIRVPPKSVLCSATSPLCALMAKDPQWTKVFEREEIKDGSVSTGPIRRWQVYVKNP